jgi:hypothetical protein
MDEKTSFGTRFAKIGTYLGRLPTVIAIIPPADRSRATVIVRAGFQDKDPRTLPKRGAHVSFLNDASAAPSVPVAFNSYN